MQVRRVLHMNKGNDETSYAQNSNVQSKILCVAKPILREAVLQILCSNHLPIETMGIADLGCSSGPNTLSPISDIMDVIHAKHSGGGGGGRLYPTSSTIKEFRVYLNDLFSNDFNSVFMSLPEFHKKFNQKKGGANFAPHLFISAVPGSFHGRLFPTRSLHFVHSSCSIHWLSQVPPGLHGSQGGTSLNKGKIYISKSSPHCVLEAYSLQFRNDFSSFLKSRAEEIVNGGRMVLSLFGRPSSDPTSEESCCQWELLAHALKSMVSEGLIEEEKLDSFDMPYYAPCGEELESEVKKEASFVVHRIDAFEIDRDPGGGETFDDKVACGLRVANSIRVVAESLLESHFGNDILDDLFRRYAELAGNYLSSKSRTNYTTLVISVVRKN